MAFSQGFLFQPSVSLALPFSSGVILGPRTEELGRSAAGSAFSPYSASAASPGFSSHLPYGGEPRATADLNSFVSPAYESSSGISGSLDYHAFGPLGSYQYGDPSYRKNATRDATATLKAWLNEHRKNPYPTKGEKIMLAIITKMTLTQVSTWFANARRRLKKENKMTWTPRNRSEDEEEEDNIDLERNEEDEEPMKLNDEEMELRRETVSCRDPASGSCQFLFRDDADRRLTDTDLDLRLPHIPGPVSVYGAPLQSGPQRTLRLSRSDCTLSPSLLSKEQVDFCSSTLEPNLNPKPKLWSLAEIAMSADKNTGSNDSSQGRGRSLLSHCPTPPRHLLYASPYMAGYSSFSLLGPLHGGQHLNGLQKKIRDCRLLSQNQNELHELKRGMTNV